MPFIARVDGDLCMPFEVDGDDSAICPSCGNRLTIRDSHHRDGAFVARHFLHPTTPPDGCQGGSTGESVEHRRMKSIAASKARSIFDDGTISVESTVDDRRADVLVRFDEIHPRYGSGIAIEVQHQNHAKDIEAVQRDFHSARYSVLWLDSDQYDGYDVSFDAGTLSAWWPTQIPTPDEWSGYHGVIHWLRQHLRPSVELSIPFPDELYSSDHAEIWAEAFYRGYDSNTDGWVTMFSAPVFDSGRTRSEVGVALNSPGWPTIFLRKIQGDTIELRDDSNLYKNRDVLRRIANILKHWDHDQRQNWAERMTNVRHGDWVTVIDTKSPIAHLKLLCHAQSGNPTLTLDDHYENDVSARVDPSMAADSLNSVLQILERIAKIRERERQNRTA